MIFIPFSEAWDVYLRAESRLPVSGGPRDTRRVQGLADVIDGFDVVVFDAYGVLHEGGAPYPGVPERVRMIREKGKQVCVLTNDVTRTPQGVAMGLREKGIDIRDEDVVSGRSVLTAELPTLVPSSERFGLIASVPGLLQEIVPTLVPLGDDEAVYDQVDGFVFVDCNGWASHHAKRFMDSMISAPRPLIVCNPDVGCPYQGQVSAEPGYFAHRVAEEASVLPLFMGKPFVGVYELLFKRFQGIEPSRMLMVGDSPHTDVLGAGSQAMGSFLVETGFLHGRDSAALFAESRLWPDFVSATL